MVNHRKEAEEEVEMNMTPMIDVVFLLIIFFLCIDFKTLEAKLPAYLPKDKGSQTFDTEPVEQLSLKIVCTNWGTEVPRNAKKYKSLIHEGKKVAFILQDHRIHWMLGPKRLNELDELVRELEKIYADPSKRVPDKNKPGQMKPMTVVIEPAQDTVYSDVATTVDAVTKSGFPEINFGGGMGRRGTQRR